MARDNHAPGSSSALRYPQAVEYMQGLHRVGIKLGNDRITELLKCINNPHTQYRIAHIAGTKGKGSTTAILSALLHAHGYRVGSYYSPFVYDLRERVQVDGIPIPKDAFARLVSELQTPIESLAQTQFGQTTEFELKTAVGLKYFAEERVDYAAIEVGIGGRLDATNVVRPVVTVITNIGLDHTAILGDTIELIAAEKAGIIKQGTPVITAAEHPAALAVIYEHARLNSAELIQVRDADSHASIGDAEAVLTEAGDTFELRTPHNTFKALRAGMRGQFQRTNAACAIAALECMALCGGFEVNHDLVRRSLLEAWLPGRMDVVAIRPTVMVDGAHNGLSAEALARELMRMQFKRLFLVVGVLSGHAPEDIVRPLAHLAYEVVATQPSGLRAISASEVADCAREYCNSVVCVEPPLQAALYALHEAGEEDLVVITGSFYTVGDIPVEALKSAHRVRFSLAHQ